MKQIKFFTKLILHTIILLNSSSISSQNVWEIIYDTEIKNTPSTKLNLDSQENYFIGISSYEEVNNAFTGNYTIFKISPDGYLLDSLKFNFNDTLTIYSKRMILNDTIFLFGVEIYQNEDSLSFINATYDTNFNYIESKSFQIPNNISSFSPLDILVINNRFIILTTLNIDTLEWPFNGIGLFEFNRNLDSVNFSFNIDDFAFPFSITKSYDNDLIVPTTGWDFNNIDTANGAIGFGFFSDDSLLPMFTRRMGSMYLHNGVSMKQYPDSNYIISAEHHLFSTKNVAVFKISNDFVALDSIIISSSPIQYPNTTYGQNLDFTDPNAIYFGSTENVQGSTASPFTNHIRITKLDSDLNVIWEKFYGGDANYFCYTLQATDDGGCIVLATRFDFLNDPDPNHLGTYILKLGPDGILTDIENAAFEVKEVLVYPNPGKELKIATGFENYSLTLIDLNGKIVYNRQALSRDSQHELSFLPGGMYIYRITSKNGEMLDSGKWVKQ